MDLYQTTLSDADNGSVRRKPWRTKPAAEAVEQPSAQPADPRAELICGTALKSLRTAGKAIERLPGFTGLLACRND